ncbi:alpha-1,2-mannosyltransferase (Kre5) [Clydaea vesicula]|uniref:Alpha-1,2-mannosyltransferase (Kre5) n=1 Tax=Clydaea vesicula TaxID=447962 RepID=A0AAD5U7W7_9FUNG|nr:alpha-1,2-mannosyltransferase (Kre5) [Clydaea vesicula]
MCLLNKEKLSLEIWLKDRTKVDDLLKSKSNAKLIKATNNHVITHINNEIDQFKVRVVDEKIEFPDRPFTVITPASLKKPDPEKRCYDSKECIVCPTEYIQPSKFNQTIGPIKRANACITVLIRNKELEGIKHSLNSFEPFINSKLRYPYVFINDKPFTETFKNGIKQHIMKLRNSIIEPDVTFALIPEKDWGYPEWINQTLAAEIRDSLKNAYIYGGLESYRFMIRYFSGPFFNLPELMKYDYYWRVEPDVDFYSHVDYDPFVFMEEKKIKYGFNILIPELMETIPTLFQSTERYMQLNNIKDKGLLQLFVSQHGHFEYAKKNWITGEVGTCGGGKIGNKICENGGCCSKWGWCGNSQSFCSIQDCVGGCNMYNGNHFWSNFELGSFEFFRGNEYQGYFNSLDKAGGFFYERWGDAPVHSLAIGMFLKKSEVHWFGDIGYRHAELAYCPKILDGCYLRLNCTNSTKDAYPKWTENHIDAWHNLPFYLD